MKAKQTFPNRHAAWLQKCLVVGLTALATLGGLPVHAATKSFPDYPLMTGGSAIPPNIMFIVDDSGSMDYLAMPANVQMWGGTQYNLSRPGLNDTPGDRSYVNNTIYYNPAKNYLPWRTSSQLQDQRLPLANFKSAWNGQASYNGGTRVDLRTATSDYNAQWNRTSSGSIPESYFYVPKANVSNPGTNAANYDKYRIASSTSVNSYDGGVVQRQSSGSSVLASASNMAVTTSGFCRSFQLQGNEDSLTFRVTSAGPAALRVYAGQACSGTPISSHTNSDTTKQLVVSAPSGWYSIGIVRRNSGTSATVGYSVTSAWSWVDATPTGRSQQYELQNFANWYQYHRTRNKMAKAGASEAFGRLGTSYRVGFDTIWNRGGGTARTGGSTPAYPIPYATEGGRFVNANRDGFWSQLHAVGNSGATPLKGALQRAARYFSTDDPWKNQDGSVLTCRQNYAILTTDGWWNDDSGYTNVGNADSASNTDLDGNRPSYPDTYFNTLADVAYEYWRTDLKPGTAWPNNVPSSAANPARWQHMVTFGVSIGLQGTLNPNAPPPRTWPNPTDNEDAERIDDLWHASLNGRGTFLVADDADKFASALNNALTVIDSRNASGSNIASSSTKTDTSTLTFVAGFTSGSWIGDLIASPFNAALTGVSSTPDWILSQTFATGRANANFKNRTVLTHNGSIGQVFGGIPVSPAFAARTGQPDAVTAADNIAYLKGDQVRELGQAGGNLRRRAHPLGDIVNSSPAYVEDSKTVYIGANDGMLHAINADSSDTANRGKILFSYVPRGVDPAVMATLSAADYSHRYFVDGQIDVISRALQGSDRNILVGAMGRGGRGVFALDVTNPTAMNTSGALWDRTYRDSETTDPNMGHVIGRVLIRKGNGDKTFAFVANGIDSPNGSATLFAYELNAAGGVQQVHELVADSSGGNGLMSLGMADLNGDGKVDTVYGGDLKGNIWRWDFSSATVPSSAAKLFQAVDASGKAQPITGGLGLGRDNLGNVFVGFGTGQFISSTDMPGVATQTTQTLYGLKDSGTAITGRADLQARTIPYSGVTASGAAARGFENYSDLPTAKKGWFIDMPVPERVISSPTIYGSGMYISSVIPPSGSDCNSSVGSGFLNAINLFTGTSPQSGSYLAGTGALGAGVVGSVGVSGGMPTEANVTSALVTVGTGAFTTENGGAGNTSSEEINPPAGGRPARINWREVPPTD